MSGPNICNKDWAVICFTRSYPGSYTFLIHLIDARHDWAAKVHDIIINFSQVQLVLCHCLSWKCFRPYFFFLFSWSFLPAKSHMEILQYVWQNSLFVYWAVSFWLSRPEQNSVWFHPRVYHHNTAALSNWFEWPRHNLYANAAMANIIQS